jgi:integrase
VSRPRYQQGQIVHRGSFWVLRFHEDRISAEGTVKRVRTTEPIVPYASYPYKGTPTDIQRLRDQFQSKIASILARVNQGHTSRDAVLTLAEFIEKSYFPRLDYRFKVPAGNELHIEPSTIQGYHYVYEGHIKGNPVAQIPLIHFTAQDGRRLMESVPQTLSHRRHLRIKNFLSGVFAWAISDGGYHGVNPMAEIKVGGHTEKAQEDAYTLEEVADLLEKLDEPARTVCAVAAFTGLSHSELPGLKWSDYDRKYITVQRKITGNYVHDQQKVVGRYIGPPKTTARKASIPVIPQLQQILEGYRKQFPPTEENWIFRGNKSSEPLNLDNFVRREIRPYIKDNWHGWHAFRRGLGTRLNDLGVDTKTIQGILRHSNISTTLAFYILPSKEKAEAGLRKLSKALEQYKII